MAPKKTKYGTWQVRWRDPTGKQRAQAFKRQQDAIAFERETLVDQQRGNWVDPDLGKITLKDWAAEWLASAHNLRPRGKATYEEALVRILPALGHLPIGRTTSTHIDEYLTDLATRVGPWTVHRHYRVLRRLFRVAVQRGRIPKSPIDAVEEPLLPDDEMRFMTASEVEDLADAMAPEYRSLARVGGYGGPRWGELAGLKVRRVDVERSRIQIVEQRDQTGKRVSPPKSKAGRRWITIPRSVMDELAEHIKDKGPDELVWTAPKGGPLAYPNFLRRDFHPAAIRAGLGQMVLDEETGEEGYEGVTPHTLRHTSVALAIAEGAHPKAIQERLGDSSIKITLDRYGHLFPEMDATLGQRLDDTRSAVLKKRRKLRAV